MLPRVQERVAGAAWEMPILTLKVSRSLRRSRRPLCASRRMTDNQGLHVEVRDGEIVVTFPHTGFAVTYYKLPNDPQRAFK
jgi:hypothetical protein